MNNFQNIRESFYSAGLHQNKKIYNEKVDIIKITIIIIIVSNIKIKETEIKFIKKLN